jgi:hypothetical protein
MTFTTQVLLSVTIFGFVAVSPVSAGKLRGSAASASLASKQKRATRGRAARWRANVTGLPRKLAGLPRKAAGIRAERKEALTIIRRVSGRNPARRSLKLPKKGQRSPVLAQAAVVSAVWAVLSVGGRVSDKVLATSLAVLLAVPAIKDRRRAAAMKAYKSGELSPAEIGVLRNRRYLPRQGSEK